MEYAPKSTRIICSGLLRPRESLMPKIIHPQNISTYITCINLLTF